MRKLIFFLLTITFIIVSYLSIKQFEFLQFQSFNYNDKAEKINVEIKEGNPKKTKLENFQLLSDISSKAKVNLQRISYEMTESNQEKIVYYVSFYNSNNYFEKIKLKTGYYLNENSNKNDFLSTVQTGSENQIGQLEIFHSFKPIEIRPMIDAEKTKDIKGTYTVNGIENIKEFEKIATDYGFSVKISKEDAISLFTKYPYQNMIYITSFVLCLLILLSITYDVINNYKAIAIQYMHGLNFLHIGVYLLRRYLKLILSSYVLVIMGLVLYLYFYNHFQQIFPFLYFWIKNNIFLFIIIFTILIIAWMETRCINISQMIKNKKPVKLFFYLNIAVRFVLAIFLIIGLQQGINTFNTLKDTTSQQNKWELMKNYAYLGLGIDSKVFDYKNDEELNKFKKLYEELENQGAVYISPSYYYLNHTSGRPHELDPNPWGLQGKQVAINENYLALNPIYDGNNKIIKLPKPSKYEIIVLVPEKYMGNQEDIKNSIKKDYSRMLNRKDPETTNINIIYVKNEQVYFTFSTQMAEDSKYLIKDPVAVVITREFEPFYTSSTIAMGYGYFTKNDKSDNPFEKIQQTFKTYGLDNIWKPVSIAYANVEQKIANDTEKFQLTIIYCVLFLVFFAVLLFFSAIYYLEMFKQLLALQWVFGYSYLEKHYLVYLALLLFWQLSFMGCYFISNKDVLLLIEISLGLALFDILLISFLLIINEYKITRKILINK